MKTKKFLRKKNKIIHKVTNTTLVPEDQIQNVPFKYLELFGSFGTLHSDLCPYCLIFNNICKDKDRNECPMSKAINNCGNDLNNTWEEANEIWQLEAQKEDLEALQKLVDKYNASNTKA